ncbi:MAG: hypothetical protein Q7O66_02015 [Dehalococcoidia bacterium]|nr:hypothetical protein [Dehalococcoidia bacterium]
MPKSFRVPSDAEHSGMEITYTKSRRVLYIGGWYDDFVGIQGEEISLADFFERLGITRKEIDKEMKGG